MQESILKYHPLSPFLLALCFFLGPSLLSHFSEVCILSGIENFVPQIKLPIKYCWRIFLQSSVFLQSNYMLKLPQLSRWACRNSILCTVTFSGVLCVINILGACLGAYIL